MLGTAVDPAPIAFEHLSKVVPLDPFSQFSGDLVQWASHVEREIKRFVVVFSRKIRGQVFRPNDVTGSRDDELLDQVLQLADVPWPIVAGQPREGFSRERLGRVATFSEAVEEVVDQQRQVLDPVSKRGQGDGDDVESEEQVFSKPTFGDGASKVEVRRGENPGIHLDGVAAADAFEGAVLQDSKQLGLHAKR